MYLFARYKICYQQLMAKTAVVRISLGGKNQSAMSVFNAINLSPRDEQVEAEEHSRELQIEEGFKLYEDALASLNNKKFHDSNEKFELLFEMNIMKPDKWGFFRYSSPTLNRLRYLAFRNRGMFYYWKLLENYQDSMNSADIVNDILKIIENLVESIQHGDADSVVTIILAEIYKSFKTPKLERLILEYEINKNDNNLLLLGRKRICNIMPQVMNIISRYQQLLTDLKENNCDKDSSLLILLDLKCNDTKPSPIKLDPRFKAILDRIKELKSEDEITMKKLDITEIEMNELTWDYLGQTLKNQLPSIKNAILLGRNSDPYNEIEYPIEGIKFNIDENKTKNQASKIVDTSINSSDDNSNTAEVKESHTSRGVNLNEETSENLRAKRSIEFVETPKPRTSKRFRDRESIDSSPAKSDGANSQNIFFLSLQRILSEVGCPLPIKFEDITLDHNSGLSTNPLAKVYDDMFYCLKNWNSGHTDIFNKNDQKSSAMSKEGPNETMQLYSLLKTNLVEDKELLVDSVKSLPNDTVIDFINDLSNMAPHFHEVRFKFLQRLLDSKSGERKIVNYRWSANLYKITQWMVLTIESNIYDFLITNIKEYWHFGLSVYEVLVDLMGSICQEINAKKSQKSRISDLKTQKNKLQRKISALYTLLYSNVSSLGSSECVMLQWAYYYSLQFSKDIMNTEIINTLTGIVEKIETKSMDIEILYPNYPLIPPLTLITARTQLKKISMIRNITTINIEDPDQGENNLKILETVLLQGPRNNETGNNDHQEMTEFIASSPFSLKLKLWDILFSHYLNIEDGNSINRVFYHMIHLLETRILSDEYNNERQENRITMLLPTLSILGNLVERFSIFLNKKDWQLAGTQFEDDYLQLVVKIFFLFYPILYFENISKYNSDVSSFFKRVTKSSARMKDQIIAIISLILFYFSEKSHRLVPEKAATLNIQLVACIHSFVGNLSFCDAANYYFLNIAEKLLCELISNQSYIELKEVLWCKYHFTIAGDSQNVEQHETNPTVMNRDNSLPLGIYLMKLHYNSMNPLLVNVGRASLKPVLDSIIETVGNVSSFDNYIVTRNKYVFDEYFNLPITLSLLRDILKGQLTLNFTSPKDYLQKSMDAGLFYVTAVLSLNQYSIRKKQMQARPSELDSIIRTIKCDILYNTRRFESWYLLGKCFSYIVEDDLIWTSDKLTSKEKKNSIAQTQRKVILCYFMSISIYFCKADHVKEDELVLKMIFEALGNELQIAFYKPMEKLCFRWRGSDTFLSITESFDVSEKKLKDVPSISDYNIEQAILLCFSKANAIAEKSVIDETGKKGEWMNFYKIAKTLFKSSKEDFMKAIFGNITKACELAIESSTYKDVIIEPHYALVNMCYKYVKIKKLNPQDALTFIKSDPLYNKDEDFWLLIPTENDDSLNELFNKKVVELLRYLIACDKKNWYHRPNYRIAKILFEDFHDCKNAIDEMNKFVSLKSSKNLVGIWKPDFERPGKHFVYTYQYVIFYIELLLSARDFNSIALVIKKIRRFGSGMAYVNEAISFAMKSYVTCTYLRLEIDDMYIENILSSLKYQEFLRVSENLANSFSRSDYPEEFTEGLKLGYQLKKGSSGIVYDGACLSLYFKEFYMPFSLKDKVNEEIKEKNTESPSSILPTMNSTDLNSKQSSTTLSVNSRASSHKRRVSKKEAFDRIKVLTEKIS